MDNRVFDIQSEGRKAFDLAIELAFDNAAGGKATHYLNHPEKGFVLFWHHAELAHPSDINARLTTDKLPYAMDWKDSANIAWNWLNQQPKEAYREYVDHDGSMGKGFKVYNEVWRRVAGSPYAICAILPIFAWYGK